MSAIFSSLKDVPEAGVEMTGGDGAVRRQMPILAIYGADYVEQVSVTGTRYNWCPKCETCKGELGDNIISEIRDPKDVLSTINQARQKTTIADSEEVLKEKGLNLVQPFWKGLPHANIFEAITPDLLHQMYQGMAKHLVLWLQNLMTEAELDARIKRLPRVHGVRYFSNGISGLSRVSGKEHKNICKQLLGCIIGIPHIPSSVICAARALLDFIYLAEYRSHSTGTLKYLQEALDEFHLAKEVFINLGARIRTCCPAAISIC
jgi:hypothetical protein